MPVPPMPPGFEQIGSRPFSFYPPVVNVEHNEWHYRKATWSEVLVVNAKTGLEVWIPRLYIGEFSRIDEPVVIVGLTKELEYKGGQVWPYVRRVIEMPRAVNEGYRPDSGRGAPSGLRRRHPNRKRGRIANLAAPGRGTRRGYRSLPRHHKRSAKRP